MKQLSTVLFLIIALFHQSSVSFPQDKKPSLLAAPYPGPIAESYPDENNAVPALPLESRLQAFYSKDPSEKVKAHYSGSPGKWEETFETIVGQYAAVVPGTQLREILTERGLELGEAGWSVDILSERAGVTIYGKPPTCNVSVAGVLDKLRNAHLLRFMGVEGEDGPAITRHLEDPEFKKTFATYGHLQGEYFPREKEKRMDEVLIGRHFTIPEKGLMEEQAALTKKMTVLTTAGPYDEAGKVGERMMGISSRPADAKINRDLAVNCPEEMAVHAYPSKIVIDRPPAERDLPGAAKK